jgi:hypothetical protein
MVIWGVIGFFNAFIIGIDPSFHAVLEDCEENYDGSRRKFNQGPNGGKES